MTGGTRPDGRAPADWRREAMDDPGVDPDLLADSLDHLARLTALSGVRRAIGRAVERLAPAGPVRIVDVGAGGGDVMRYTGERLGGRLELGLCVEPHATTAACGSARCGDASPVRYLRAEAGALPFADGAFDIAMMHMALHHLPPETRAGALAELARVARGGVLVTDLTRSALNRAGARLLAATVWRTNPVVRKDAPLSVERGFTRAELEAIAADAGLRDVRVRGLWGHRLLLTAAA